MPEMASSQSMWNVPTCCMPTAVHRRARAGVDRHRLSEDPGQSQVLEPVPEELTRSFARQAVAPVAAQDPVPELGLPIDRALVGALRRLQDPPADELAIDEPGPEAESRNPPRGRETSPVEPLDLLLLGGSTVLTGLLVTGTGPAWFRLARRLRGGC